MFRVKPDVGSCENAAQEDLSMDRVTAKLVSLGQVTPGLLDANGDWRDEAVQLVQLIEAYREGREINFLIASDVSSFRLMGWDESTERGLKALYFAEAWNACRQPTCLSIEHAMVVAPSY